MALWRFLVINVITASGLMPTRLRNPLLRLAGVDIGERSLLREVLHFTGDVAIGHACFLNSETWLDAGDARIVIGDHVVIGPRCLISAAGHVIGVGERRAGPLKSETITIGDGCWIGAGALVGLAECLYQGPLSGRPGERVAYDQERIARFSASSAAINWPTRTSR